MVRVKAEVVTSGEKMAEEAAAGLPPVSGLVSVDLACSISRIWLCMVVLVTTCASWVLTPEEP